MDIMVWDVEGEEEKRCQGAALQSGYKSRLANSG